MLNEEPDVDQLTKMIGEIYDSMETNLMQIMFSGLEAVDLQKANDTFFRIKEKYRTAHIVYWATLLRATGMLQEHLTEWNKLLEETKARAEKEFGAEGMKDILYGMI